MEKETAEVPQGEALPYLIVPDVHEDLVALAVIEERFFSQAEHIYFLGDWFDTFGRRRPEAVSEWVKARLDDDKYTWLLGNHDAHYFFGHPSFICSGYNRATLHTVNHYFTAADKEKFRLWVDVGEWTLSHAGFHRSFLRYKTEEEHSKAFDLALAGHTHPLFHVGRARGGPANFGGPIWLDWNYEFSPVDGMKQLVGHTQGKFIKKEDDNYCIDTSLRHVAWTDGKTMKIELSGAK